MNGVYLHLIVNHIPVLGVPFCLILLAAGFWRKSNDLIGAGLIGLILVALVTLVVDESGEAAARIARTIPGIERVRIKDHAHNADGAIISGEVVAGLAMVGLWFMKRKGKLPVLLSVLVLAGALWTSMWYAWVAHLGGLIRHPEMESYYQSTAAAQSVQPVDAPGSGH